MKPKLDKQNDSSKVPEAPIPPQNKATADSSPEVVSLAEQLSLWDKRIFHAQTAIEEIDKQRLVVYEEVQSMQMKRSQTHSRLISASQP